MKQYIVHLEFCHFCVFLSLFSDCFAYFSIHYLFLYLFQIKSQGIFTNIELLESLKNQTHYGIALRIYYIVLHFIASATYAGCSKQLYLHILCSSAIIISDWLSVFFPEN